MNYIYIYISMIDRKNKNHETKLYNISTHTHHLGEFNFIDVIARPEVPQKEPTKRLDPQPKLGGSPRQVGIFSPDPW